MEVIQALLARRSVSPRLMHEPGPTADQIDTLLRTGARAADHGRLRPWQFVVVQGDARARLGEVFAQARIQRDPAASEADLAKERAKPLRAPLVIVVAARIRHDREAIRPVDQLLAAAAAAQNVLLAAYALGYGAMWLTGSNGHDPQVKVALGLQPEDEFVGFLYIGSVDALASMPPAEVDLEGVVRLWEAPIKPM
ncbi:MAG: nitroreductase [Brachymonas sp.]